MLAEGLAAEGMDARDWQLAEKAIFLKAEPGRTRFARFETKTVQRQKFRRCASLRGSVALARRLRNKKKKSRNGSLIQVR